jgi:prepilin-type N-terminal cleavage/methylation domain-containing protein
MRTPRPDAPITHPARSRAFSLIELLVVLIIIAVLISIVVPVLGNVRNQARRAGTMSMITQVGNASQSFLNDSRRLPGLYDPAALGSAINDAPDVGMSGMENILADLMGPQLIPADQTPPAGSANDWITIGPFQGMNNPKNYKLNFALLGSTAGGSKSYFNPDAKHLIPQTAGISQIGGLENAAGDGAKQMPDLVDDWGNPFLAWVRDENYRFKPGAPGFKFASMHSGPANAGGDPTSAGMYYWASNACFLRSTALGRRSRDQTDTQSGSIIGPAISNQLNLEKSLTGILGHPSFPYRPAGQTGYPTIPAAGRGSVILHSAGPDGVYFGMKDRGSRQFPLVGSTPIADYQYSFTSDGTNPQLDRHGQPTTHDVASEFDDLLTASGN